MKIPTIGLALLLALAATNAKTDKITTMDQLRKAKKQAKKDNKLRRAAVGPRIIGGSRVKTPYPYFALMEIGCGATLIHDDSEYLQEEIGCG